MRLFCAKSSKERMPKTEAFSGQITKQGVEGDHNRYRKVKKKNTPDRALLRMTTDVLAALQKEGYPVNPGDLGENLLLDIPYASLHPGNAYRIQEVEFEITELCTPCKNLLKLPYGSTKLLKTLQGRRGWFAKVTTEGTLRRTAASPTLLKRPR
jgi:MOSC domain-containing protein YiiM